MNLKSALVVLPVTAVAPQALVASLSFCSLFGGPESVPLDEVPRTTPVRTVRFPGANYSSLAQKDGLVVTCSHWSREDTSGVFDVSDPTKPKFLARFPAKGYSCAKPVFWRDFCYVPNGFSAMVIDLKDRQKPQLKGYLNPHFPENGCKQLWTEGNDLYFEADDGVYRVTDDALAFVKADKQAPPRKGGAKVQEPVQAVTLRESRIETGGKSIPFAYDLSTIAVTGETAYVYSTWKGGAWAHLLALDIKTGGLRMFSDELVAAELPHDRNYQTMGMQTANSVRRVGDLFFVDDGIVRLNRKGGLETLLERTRPASNSSLDGHRIAIAQCTRCRVLDFASPKDVKVLDVTPKADLPVHVTGCSLKGNDLFLAYTLVESKGQNYIYKMPTRGYVAYVNLERPAETRCVLEIPVCIALERVGDFLYVTGRRGDFAVVDASDPDDLRLSAKRDDLLDGDGYKIKGFGGRVFLLNGHHVAELDVSVPSMPQVKHLYGRAVNDVSPGYDDFTVEGGCLYALAHASIDVFRLDDPERTATIPNTCGVRGVDETPLVEAEAKVFAGHRPNTKPPAGVDFEAGRFGNCFGGYVFDWARLADGGYAVAYGEAGIVFCDKDGRFRAEPKRGKTGYPRILAKEVVVQGDVAYVGDGTGKCFAVKVP